MCDAHKCEEEAQYVWEVPELAQEAEALGFGYHRPEYCVVHSAYAAQNPTFKYVGEVAKETC